LNDGTRNGAFKININRKSLFEKAQEGGFFSYVCGVAYQILTDYQVRGLKAVKRWMELAMNTMLCSCQTKYQSITPFQIRRLSFYHSLNRK
jgi:hypothetical protein